MMDMQGSVKKGDTQKLLAASEISLLLDTYDDIFSDFDPRPFDRRALSDDFLLEAKKAARDKEGTLELRFMIPRSQRNIEREAVIRQRLHEHFKRHHDLLTKEVQQIKRRGWIMGVCGILMIILASYLLSLTEEAFWVHVLIVILEPAGWFTAWTGMDDIYNMARHTNHELVFYGKMMHATIVFTPY